MIKRTMQGPPPQRIVLERELPRAATLPPPSILRAGVAPSSLGGYKSALASLADAQVSTLDQPIMPSQPTLQIDASDMIAAVAANNARLAANAIPMSAPEIAGPVPVSSAGTYPLPAQNSTVAVAQSHPSVGQRLALPQDVSRVINMMLAGQDAAVRSFYRSRNNRPAWYSNTGWTGNALTAHASMQNSLFDGLPPFRYGPIVNQELPNNGLPNDVARADIALSAAMITYLVDLRDGLSKSGRTNNGKTLLASALRKGDLTRAIERQRPKNQHYVALSNALRTQSLTDKQRGTALVNLERFRKWRAPHGGRYIQVNLPSQQLYGFNGSNLDIQMPVIVGQLSRQTPVLSDRITDLKFSPDWTVPSSIAKKDIFPILASKGSSAVSGMNLRARKNGRFVDMTSVNWSRAKSSDYEFYQPPGPSNALGGVRFSLTNPRGIYLHDTPDRDLFNAPQRVLSSGCVRVGDASALSTWILRNQGWSQNKVLDAMNRGRTNTVPLKRSLPVEFTYYTAYAEPDGTVRFWSDIYGLDRQLAMKLGI